jgi:hypothetical protein
VNAEHGTAHSVDLTKAERWVYADRMGKLLPQIFQFTTPISPCVSVVAAST